MRRAAAAGPLATLALCWLTSCVEPPVREIDAAQATLARAREGGAERFAADRFKEAERALRTAREKLEARDYRGALSAASDADEKSRDALRAAEIARTLAKSSAQTALVEAETVFDDVKAVRDEAVEAKVPDEAFQDLEPALQEAQEASKSIAAMIDGGQIDEAIKATSDMKAKTGDLPGRYRQALEDFQRTRGKRRAKAKPPKTP